MTTDTQALTDTRPQAATDLDALMQGMGYTNRQEAALAQIRREAHFTLKTVNGEQTAQERMDDLCRYILDTVDAAGPVPSNPRQALELAERVNSAHTRTLAQVARFAHGLEPEQHDELIRIVQAGIQRRDHATQALRAQAEAEAGLREAARAIWDDAAQMPGQLRNRADYVMHIRCDLLCRLRDALAQAGGES